MQPTLTLSYVDRDLNKFLKAPNARPGYKYEYNCRKLVHVVIDPFSGAVAEFSEGNRENEQRQCEA